MQLADEFAATGAWTQTVNLRDTSLPAGALVRLWGAGLAGGAAGFAVMHLFGASHHMVRGLLALGTFSLVYGAITVALGVPEAKALASRVLRR